MCVSLTSDFSETVEVIIIKLGMVTASESDMLMHHVFIILTLTFHSRSHRAWSWKYWMFDYFRNCSSYAHHICCEDSLTKGLYNFFSVRYLVLHSRSPTAFQTWQMLNLDYNSHILDSTQAMASKLGMTVDLGVVYITLSHYMLMLVSMTLLLMQGHSGSAKAKIHCVIILTTKPAQYTIVYMTLTL